MERGQKRCDLGGRYCGKGKESCHKEIEVARRKTGKCRKGDRKVTAGGKRIKKCAERTKYVDERKYVGKKKGLDQKGSNVWSEGRQDSGGREAGKCGLASRKFKSVRKTETVGIVPRP